MPLKPIDTYPGGGVSSRDNPIVMPPERYLAVHDLWPQTDGSFRLRDGYSVLFDGLQPGVPIHSITSVVGPGPDYDKLIVFWQAKIPYVYNTRTKIVSTPTVKGRPISSSSRFCYFYTNGHLYAVNGSDAKWFDGTVWRDIGLPTLSAQQVASITVSEGMSGVTAAEAAAVTLTPTSGGSTPVGPPPIRVYMAFWDTATDQIISSPFHLGTANSIQLSLNQKLVISNLPTRSLSTVVGLLGEDQGLSGHATFVSGLAFGTMIYGTLSGAGTTVTVHSVTLLGADTPHGLSTGDVITIDSFNTPWNSNGPFTVTVVDSSHFTFKSPNASLYNETLVTAFQKLLVVPHSSTTATIMNIENTIAGQGYLFSANGTLLLPYMNDLASAGIPASTIGGAQPGYQFYASIYNPTTGHVGNRQPIGIRFNNASSAIALIAGLPDLSVAPYGPAPAATGTDVTVGGTAWTNPGGVAGSSSGYASVTAVASHFLLAGGFDIASLSIPSDAIVTGLEVRASISNTAGILGVNLSESSGSATFAATKSAPISATHADMIIGGPSDLWGLPAIALTDLTNPNFAVAFFIPSQGSSNSVEIQNVRVIVYAKSATGGGLSDPEWTLLIGRTADGAEVPYVIIDAAGNWLYVPNEQTSVSVSQGKIDGNSELPSRNWPPPGTLDYNDQLAALPGGAVKNPPITGTFKIAWVESDHCCGVLDHSPTVYRSGSAQDMREGQFVGLPEQSWAPVDIETFPTGQPVVAGHGYEGESMVFSRQDSGVLLELAGETQWNGPWNIGTAGQYAYTRGWQNLPYWVTGKKQLATISLGVYTQVAGMGSIAKSGPIVISQEYEAALLAKIGDAYLSQVEVNYIRHPHKLVDVLRIKCRDSQGCPFVVIHDFNLRDARSPYGQGYEERPTGSLQSTCP